MLWLFLDTKYQNSYLVKLNNIDIYTKNKFIEKIKILIPALNPILYWDSVSSTKKLISKNMLYDPTVVSKLFVKKYTDKVKNLLLSIDTNPNEFPMGYEISHNFINQVNNFDNLERVYVACKSGVKLTDIYTTIATWEKRNSWKKYFYYINFDNLPVTKKFYSLGIVFAQTDSEMRCNNLNCKKLSKVSCEDCGMDYCSIECKEIDCESHNLRICNFIQNSTLY
jgi:hypothetical protein